MNKYPVGILGASGYTGRELVRLVRRHPHLSLAFAAAASRAGDTVRIDGAPLTFDAADAVADRLGDVALVFSALPHGASGDWVARAHLAGARVVDLSTDLRPGNPRPAALEALDAPYGMPELHGAASRAAIAGAAVVANPGCYPTATLLAIAPLLRAGLVAPDATIVVDAASGVSGAGNAPRADLLFGEVTEDFRAYGTGNAHRHLHEMAATVATLGGGAELLFTPHLLPVARGILATITVPLAAPLADAMAPFRDAYAHEPFVELADAPPTLADVRHRNVVRLFAQPAARLARPHLSVFAAIDNLVKGAAGQAVQNANLMLALPETAGLA